MEWREYGHNLISHGGIEVIGRGHTRIVWYFNGRVDALIKSDSRDLASHGMIW